MRRHDIVVVGGGIHGAGIAQAAAAAGHDVLLLEKTALAAGTSSRSSKLIHGGLRYLESGQLRLVREGLHERALLLRNAPDLVRLQKFYLPVYPRTRRRPWQLRTGLALYAALGGFDSSCRFRDVPRSGWTALDGLDTDDLQAVLCYYDGQTDDATLTRAVMASALSLGAALAMPAEFLGAEIRPGEAVVRYRQSGGDAECSAQVLVNAGGPWADRIAAAVQPQRPVPAVELVRGTHILLTPAVEQGIYYVESETDGRAVFVMPRGNHALVGTTEAIYTGDPARVAPMPAEIDYLLAVAGRYFPRFRGFGARDVMESWAGLRVLPAGRGAAFHRSRETLFDVDDTQRPRFISVYGGKLTTYRATAQKVLERIAPALPQRTPRANTARLRLAAAAAV